MTDSRPAAEDVPHLAAYGYGFFGRPKSEKALPVPPVPMPPCRSWAETYAAPASEARRAVVAGDAPPSKRRRTPKRITDVTTTAAIADTISAGWLRWIGGYQKACAKGVRALVLWYLRAERRPAPGFVCRSPNGETSGFVVWRTTASCTIQHYNVCRIVSGELKEEIRRIARASRERSSPPRLLSEHEREIAAKTFAERFAQLRCSADTKTEVLSQSWIELARSDVEMHGPENNARRAWWRARWRLRQELEPAWHRTPDHEKQIVGTNS